MTGLDPRFLPQVNEWLERCNNEITDGHVRVTVTYRGPAAQKIAAITGKSKASYGQSPHNCVDISGNQCARAVDFAIIDPHGAYVSNGEDHRYTQAGKLAESLGIEWGGSWKPEKDGCDPDYDHIQMANWKSVKPYDPAALGENNAPAPTV